MQPFGPASSSLLVSGIRRIKPLFYLSFSYLLPISDSNLRSIIDFQSNNDLGRIVAREYEAAASRARRPFLPIYLEGDIKEDTRRIANPQWGSSGTTKLLSPEVLAEMQSRCQVFRFDAVKGIIFDVTNMGPEEAAAALARGRVKYWK